jgi:putative ABC transport system permease protein
MTALSATGVAPIEAAPAAVRAGRLLTAAGLVRTTAALAKARGVELVSGIRFDRARAAGANASVNGVDPKTIDAVYRFDWKRGPADAASTLRPGEALVKESFAKDNHLAIGDRIEVTAPNGHVAFARVKAIFGTPKFDSVLGGVVLSQAQFDRTFPRPRNALVLANVGGDVSGATTTRLKQALAGFADTKVATRDDWAKQRASGFTQVLNLLYVLLALSVLVSLFGMVDTLALSVFGGRGSSGCCAPSV